MRPQNILVVGPSWIGDMVIAQSLFKLLLEEHPRARIDVLAPRWSGDLLAAMPEVRRSLAAPWGHWQFQLAARRRLGRQLRGENYSQAIVLPNSYKSALTPFFARIPLRTGWRGEWRYGLLNDIRVAGKEQADRTTLMAHYAALATAPGNPPQRCPEPRLAVSRRAAAELARSLRLDTERPALAVCPGAAYGPAKRWPSSHFAAVVKQRVRAGWQAWIVGGADDAQAGAEIAAQCGSPEQCVNWAGQLPLGKSIELMSLATQALTNDSGLMHVAAALQLPLAALFGSTSPQRTPPLSPLAVVLSLDLPCSPCFQRTCPLGHTDCLVKLGPERALAALDALPAKPRSHSH